MSEGWVNGLQKHFIFNTILKDLLILILIILKQDHGNRIKNKVFEKPILPALTHKKVNNFAEFQLLICI